MDMITPEQCRAARAMLGWSQQALANASRVGVVTIRQFEIGASTPRNATVQVLRLALEAAGVVFVADGEQVDGGAGVRLRGQADLGSIVGNG
ncbi:helix-turn-helix domain-containing protein [Mesorhizobium sp. M7D.F.Ca.US.004.03.1.1]|uniref:helix-turn-helix domain-containing protein n=1 Tax=unclassified Mesorhizobium TaxID=325217 RepID=UPI0026CE2777